MRLDAVIFGGGGAGLWLLDELIRRGHTALLLEAHALGHGQTIASQGIIHGGTKYSLRGWASGSARAIREMPARWRDCLEGRGRPALRDTRLCAEHCHLWGTRSLRSRLGMLGARWALHVAPRRLARSDCPAALAQCRGAVHRLDEPVIDTASFLRDLASAHRDHLLKFDMEEGIEFDRAASGDVTAIRIRRPEGDAWVALEPSRVIFAAGAGNAALRERAGLTDDAMQRRPLHMVMARGALPTLNGHCIDGGHTRVTITTNTDAAGRTIWQIGGQVSEDGVAMEPADLIAHAQREVRAVLPGIDLSTAQWTTHRVDRAEGKMPTGQRPQSVQILREGNVLTAWPTKLVLAPVLAAKISEQMHTPSGAGALDLAALADWPRPEVAKPPWEEERVWT